MRSMPPMFPLPRCAGRPAPGVTIEAWHSIAAAARDAQPDSPSFAGFPDDRRAPKPETKLNLDKGRH